MKIWNKIVAALILVIQLILYPIHFLFRVLARSFLIILTAGFFVPLSLLLVVGLGIGLWEWLETEGWKEDGKDFSGPIALIAFLSVLGAVANFLKRKWKAMCGSSLNVIAVARLTVTNVEWLPRLDVKESVRDTWHGDLCMIWPSMKSMGIASRRFVGAAALFLITCTFAYLPIRDFEAWREDVDKKLAELEAIVTCTTQPSPHCPDLPEVVAPAQVDDTFPCPECLAPRPPAVHTGPS